MSGLLDLHHSSVAFAMCSGSLIYQKVNLHPNLQSPAHWASYIIALIEPSP